MWIGHRKEIRKLTFRALAVSRSESEVSVVIDHMRTIQLLLSCYLLHADHMSYLWQEHSITPNENKNLL